MMGGPERERNSVLLRIDRLCLSFHGRSGQRRRVLDHVSLDVGAGEVVALVGESGSGKSMTALSIMGLQGARASIDAGAIWFDGMDLAAIPKSGMRMYRGKRIGVIFQHPKSGLNPMVTGGEQIARVIQRYKGIAKADARHEAVELMRLVGIREADVSFHAYPHQLSGGMAGRVMIAMAVAAEPELLIADEPTTGLDVTLQAQIIDLLLDLREKRGMSLLLITHDLALAAQTCDRAFVMQRGTIVEAGPIRSIFGRPVHPYTRLLLNSMVKLDARMSVGKAKAGRQASADAGGLLDAARADFEPGEGLIPEFMRIGDTDDHYALVYVPERGVDRKRPRRGDEPVE